MTNFYETVLTVLKSDERFVAEDGTFLRNAVYEAAMKMDKKFLRLLLVNDEIRDRFFVDVDGVKVFDKRGFAWVINNRQFLPDSYTRFKNKIGLADENGDLISNSGKVELVFPYKDCVLEGGQTKEDQKRQEIFYNETLAPDEVDRLLYPKVLCNARRYTADGVEENIIFNENDNLIIKGNNILALSSLCERYANKIQFIYIDPPYNTANDSFKYNDSFKRSTWLSFMKTRLLYAQKLLRKSGVIAIQINYKEYSYLKVLCDEVLGEENYITTVTIKTATTASFRAINDCPVNVSEFIVIYAKNKAIAKIKPVYVACDYSEDYGSFIKNFDQDCSSWEIVPVDNLIYEAEGVSSWQEYKRLHGENWKEIRHKKKTAFCMKYNDRIVSLNTMQKPSQEIIRVTRQSRQERNRVFQVGTTYIYNGRSLAFFSKKLREIDGKVTSTEILTNIWTDISFLSLGNEGGVDLPNGKKPEKLIQRLFDLFTDRGDIVMDYHLGTGTTCAVAHKMGRNYIGVEQLDYGQDDSIVRLQNVIAAEKGGISQYVNWQGGGSFVYCELAKQNQNFVDEIEAAEDDKTLDDIRSRMVKSGFISYKVNPKDIDEAAADYAELSMADKKKFHMELLDKNLLYVNYCDIDDEEFNISERDKNFTRSFYGEK